MSSNKTPTTRKPRISVKPIWRKKQSLGNFMNNPNDSNNHHANFIPTSHHEASSPSFTFFASQPSNGPPPPNNHPLPPLYPTPTQLPSATSFHSIKAQEFSNLVDLNLLNILLSQKLQPPTMIHPTLAQVDVHGIYCACGIYNRNHFQKMKNDLDFIISILLSPRFQRPPPKNLPPSRTRRF